MTNKNTLLQTVTIYLQTPLFIVSQSLTIACIACTKKNKEEDMIYDIHIKRLRTVQIAILHSEKKTVIIISRFKHTVSETAITSISRKVRKLHEFLHGLFYLGFQFFKRMELAKTFFSSFGHKFR